ncbi:MAG: galactosyldiacylglycerol synthase [Bryobacterales bacterium]|nr:galactosyldiacylglycerol synthase [Bryobacterales bacterium]
MQTKQIDFVFFDAGGGHRAAATALEAQIAAEGRPWNVRLVNFQDVLDELDVFRKITGIRLQDIYNLILKKGWTLGSAQMLVFLHGMIRLYHPAQVRELKKFWATRKPDLVVSVIPNFARALYQSLEAAHPATPLVTVLTDMADYPPHFWMEPNQKQYWICGTQEACAQARAMGYGGDRVFGVSGMVLHPRFYEPVAADRQAERSRLGLDVAKPTGLILFGGQGSPAIRRILERLNAARTEAQFIVICGKNDALRQEVSARKWTFPVHVEGFTKEIPYFMKLADFFIGKPGPGSISEALAMELPVIVEKNAWTLPQERFNADWVERNKVGVVLNSFSGIAPAVAQLLAPGELAWFRSNAAACRNRAVFEIPPILEGLLK